MMERERKGRVSRGKGGKGIEIYEVERKDMRVSRGFGSLIVTVVEQSKQ